MHLVRHCCQKAQRIFNNPSRWQATGIQSATSNDRSTRMVTIKGCTRMVRLLAVVLLAGTVTGLSAQNPSETPVPGSTPAQAAPNAPAQAPGAPAQNGAWCSSTGFSDSDAAQTAPLPPPPPGKSTILSGEIRFVDPVRDELLLKAYGQRPIKISLTSAPRCFGMAREFPFFR